MDIQTLKEQLGAQVARRLEGTREITDEQVRQAAQEALTRLLGGEYLSVSDRRELVNEVLNRMKKLVLMAKEEGIRPVVIIPALCEPAQAREAWMDGLGVDYEKVNSQLLALGKELKAAKDRFDFELIDIQTGYEKYHKYVDGLHPTKEGYELIAQIVKEEL